jgi:FkbM family methyltransferase
MHIRSLIRPKPEYVFRPSQIVRRLTREFQHTKEYEDVMLPWGLNITIRPREAIGSCIWRLGVYELAVSEAIYRLIDPGELAIDVGANIGYITSIMATRVGPHGRVLSFEPHPVTFGELSDNVKRWTAVPGTGPTSVHRLALSDTSGAGILVVPSEDSLESGSASLARDNAAAESGYATEIRSLSEFVGESDLVGVIKIDVEGHEYRVLKGASGLLRRKRIRDVIFEEFRPYPTKTTALLEQAGYWVFSVGLNFWGLELHPGGVKRPRRSDYIPTYLATTDPVRAARRLVKRGWATLRPAGHPQPL